MNGDGRDRHGKRHREDQEYEAGESAPGSIGDSEGTTHDRVTADNRVTTSDGETITYEEYKRRQQQSEDGTEKRGSHDDPEHSWQTSEPESAQNDSVTHSGQFAELDGTTVEVEVERVSDSRNPIGTYNGHHIHVADGVPGQRYVVKLSAESGYFTGAIKQRE